MLTRLIDLSLRHRPLVILAALLMGVLGLVSFQELPLDAFPDTTPVQVQVNAAAPALSPVEVERQITAPIEQAISGLPNLETVRSVSKFGLSQVTAIFGDGTDIYLARQLVAERVASAPLPDGVQRPTLGPVSTGLGEVFQYVIHSETLSAMELRTLHHWVIRPQMVQVSGVAEINTWGGFERQFHVVIDPAQLVKYGLTLDDVAHVLRDENRNVGGGALEQAGESLLIQGQGLARGVRDIEAMVLASVDGTPLHVRDVAEVREGFETRRGAVTYQGEGEAVLGLGFMLMGESSRELTALLEARLEHVRASVPEGVEITQVYSRSHLVAQVLSTVRTNLLEGALLVVLVLFVFLGDWRAGLTVALVIPLSLCFAFGTMLQFAVAGTLMSLGAIDFGLAVDSSVIVIENAARRVDEDQSGRSVLDIVRDAAVEVRRPTLFGELIVAIVYLPVLTLEGVEGKLFRPMALTVLFVLAGSMLLSVTLMPVLASYALRRRAGSQSSAHHDKVWLVRKVESAYRPLLEWALGHSRAVLALGALAVLAAGLLATQLGSEFVPRLREQAVVINTVRLAGVSLDESVRYGTQIERLLLARFPNEVEHVWTRTGTAEVATDPMGLEVSDVFVSLSPRDEWTVAHDPDELVEAMSAALTGLPGMRSVFTQPIEMRVNEMIAGIRADVGVVIFGDDLERLGAAAQQVLAVVEQVPGAADATTEQLTGQGVLTIDVDREAAGRLGIEVSEVLNLVESLGARHVGEINVGQRRFDLVLRLHEDARRSVEQVGNILVRSRSGAQVSLASVARIAILEGPSTIQREWAKRRVVVQVNVRGRDVGSFVRDVRQALESVDLPEGYYTDIGGQFEHQERAQQRLMVVVPVALLLVLTLLFLTYGRMSDALRVFTGVPFAAVGGVLALWLRNMPFSISAGVGFIALSGVAVLGDIVLVSHITRAIAGGVPAMEAIRGAAISRLRPVLMTASVAALGFVPMALSTGVGAEVQRPLATVVVGGMLTATLATLVVLPVLYALMHRHRGTH